jgi:hypothetical protein
VIDRYKVDEIEAAADVVVWCCDEAPGFAPTRPQDRTFVGNIVAGDAAYAAASWASSRSRCGGHRPHHRHRLRPHDGRGRAPRHGVLQAAPEAGKHVAIGSINSPMQCMMKEICAQCLQPQCDPVTGKVTYVFSCFNQDQPLDSVDFAGLGARLAQNSLQEKLTTQWISACVHELRLERSVV